MPNKSKKDRIDLNAEWRVASPADDKALDDAFELQPITIRLPKRLIEQLKSIAGDKSLGYQPYVRMILTEHVQEVVEKKKKKA